MSKVEDKKIVSAKGIKCFGKNLLILAIIVAQLVVAACKPKSESKNDGPTPTPLTNSQLANNNPEVLETEEPVDSTSTPMDAAFITPEPEEDATENNTVIYLPTEEEQLKINEAAKKAYKDLEKIMPKDFCNYYSESSLADIFNCFRLNFTYLNDKNYLETLKDEEIENVKNFIYFKMMLSFLSYLGFNSRQNITYAVENGTDIKKADFKNSEMFEILDKDDFKGLDTLKLLEEANAKIENLINGNSEEFKESAIYLQRLIETIFFGETYDFDSPSITVFKDMHPCIQIAAIYEAKKGLVYIDVKSEKDNMYIKSKYNTSDLLDKFADGLPEPQKMFYEKNKKEIFELMDTLINISMNGTYEAYMTGNDSTKAIIKELMTNNDKMRLY